MDFLRWFLLFTVVLPINGAVVAFAAKHLGVMTSTIGVGMIGVCIGWGCCWLYTGAANPPAGSARSPSHNRDRSAPLEEESDKNIRMDVPSAKMSLPTDEKRP